jgi:hypothetical protein
VERGERLGLVALFVVLAFMVCCPSCANDPYQIAALGKRYQQKTVPVGMPNYDFARLARGVNWIIVDAGEWGSVKTVMPSSNETPCFLRFASAFLGSQVN